MEDQRDNAYYSLPDLILNRIRFNFANDVAMTSRVFAFTLVCCSAVYLLSAIGLLFGIHKSREEFVLIWLILQVAFFIAAIFFIVWISDGEFVKHTVGKSCFCKSTIIHFIWIQCEVHIFYLRLSMCNLVLMSAAALVCDATMWYIIYCFYHSIRLMNKLREIATVAIPCPAPGTVSTYFYSQIR